MAATVADRPVVTTVVTTVPDAVVLPAPRKPTRPPRRAAAPPPRGSYLSRLAREAAADGTLPGWLLPPGTRVRLIRPALVPLRQFRERIGTVQEYEWHSPYQTGFPVKWADTGQWQVMSTSDVTDL